MSETVVKVFLVDDHALTRDGVRSALTMDENFHIAGECGDGVTAEQSILETAADVAVVDIGLPGRDGIDLTYALGRSAPQTRVMILSMRDDATTILAAVAAGARAYCVKSAGAEAIVSAVRAVARGDCYFDEYAAPAVLRRCGAPVARADDASLLSLRDLDVLRLIAQGAGNAEIGARLDMSLGTVKARVGSILAKLGADDRTQAAVTAVRGGLI
jgi:DNA-binding NarL/FixJ family response regulator